MNLAEPFIRRPVMTTLVMLAILLFGIMAYRQLPVSDLPNVDFPAITVLASLPGASPETMASSVATPLEKEFSTIAGVDAMTSTSSLGHTQISLVFDLSRDIDAAAQDVQAAIARAARQLPPDMPTPPSYQKTNPADQPILYLSITSATLPLSAITEYGETLMAQRISMVSGVAQVLVYGSQKYAVRVQVNPVALAHRGIGLDEVAAALASENVELPTGTLYGPHKAFTLQSTGELTQARVYLPLIVAYRNGSPVRLEEIGWAYDSVENNKVAAWYCTPQAKQRAIVLAIQRQPGTNTVEVARSVKALLPTFRQQLPASVSLHVLFDRSVPIKESADDVQWTLVLVLGLVVLVIFLFLRNLSGTLIPSLTLPMSIIGTFVIMYLLDYSLDNLSLMALTLATGFVVDDAIVMFENIVRHTEMGKSRLQAALDGSREIGFTIVSMTLSLVAVFIPVLFMGGLVGRLFREFAVTIGVAILVSGFISLTLTPMLASRMLRHRTRHNRLYRASERVFDGLLYLYKASLAWSLRHRRSAMVFSAAVLAATVYLFQAIPKGFLPSEDRGQAFGFTEAIEGISYESMFEHQLAVASVIQKHPAVESFMASAGARGGISASNSGFVFLRLRPRHLRPHVDQVIQELRGAINSLPGIRGFLQNPPTIQIGGRLTKAQYQYTLQGPDTDALYRYAVELEQRIRELPDLQDVTSDLQLKNPQLTVEIDRDKAAALGVSAAQIENTLYYAYGSRQVSTIYAPNNQYQVILEVQPEYQMDPEALSLLYVRSNRGELVPLKSIATLRETIGPLTINHSGQLPSVTLSFNLKPGAPLGPAVEAVDNLARAILPATISTSFQGTAQAFQSSLQGLGLLLVVAILVIYMVLGILYESFIHPLTILTALPFAGFGALVTLMLFNRDLSIYAFVGLIMLVGLVKKNGIMMIDFAIEAQRAQRLAPAEAIFQACVIRFRPIMMTTLAALMAGLPIAMGLGAGAESRQPLGLATVGGLVFSQFLTLYITPVFYLYMEGFQQRLRRLFHQPALVPEAEPAGRQAAS